MPHKCACKCTQAPGVGEYLLSLGLQSADPKQLAAGEGLRRICTGGNHDGCTCGEEDAAKDRAAQEAADAARWESLQKGLLDEIHRHMSSASGHFQLEANRVAEQAEALRQQATDFMTQHGSRSEETHVVVARVEAELRALQDNHTAAGQAAAEQAKEWALKVEVLKREHAACEEALRRERERASAAEAKASRDADRLATATEELTGLRRTLDREARDRADLKASLEKERELGMRTAGESQAATAALHAKILEMTEVVAAAKLDYERKCLECDAKTEEAESAHRELNNLLSSRLEDVDALKKSFGEQMAELRAKRERAEQGLEASRTRTDEVARELADAKAAAAITAHERDTLRARVGELDASLKECQTERAHAKDKLRCAEKHAEDAAQRSTASAEAAEQAVNAARDKTKTAREECQRAVDALAAERDTTAGLQRELAEAQASIAELTVQAKALKETMTAEAGARADAEAATRGAIDDLKAELAAARGARDDALRRCADAEGDAAAARGEAAQLAAVLEEVQLRGDPELRAQVDRSTLAAAELETTLKSYESVQESLSARNEELVDTLKDLRMDLEAMTEERDALKESLAMGRYDAMDHCLQTSAPKLTSAEARQLRQDSDDYRRIKAMMERLVDYLHTSALQMQEVLADLLTCLPSVPPMQDIDVKELETTHAHLSSLLRDVARTHIEATRREEQVEDDKAVAEVREKLVSASAAVRAQKPSKEQQLLSMLGKVPSLANANAAPTVGAPSRTTAKRAPGARAPAHSALREAGASAGGVSAASTAHQFQQHQHYTQQHQQQLSTMDLSASPIPPAAAPGGATGAHSLMHSTRMTEMDETLVARAAAAAALADLSVASASAHAAASAARSTEVAAAITATAHGYTAVPRCVSPTRRTVECRAKSPVRQSGVSGGSVSRMYAKTSSKGATKTTMKFGGVYSVPVARP